MTVTDASSSWYAEGLRFECTRCGRCCRGPGNVWISDPEIEALAKLTGRSDNWQSEKRSCPGIGEGPLLELETIGEKLADDGIPDHRTRIRQR